MILWTVLTLAAIALLAIVLILRHVDKAKIAILSILAQHRELSGSEIADKLRGKAARGAAFGGLAELVDEGKVEISRKESLNMPGKSYVRLFYRLTQSDRALPGRLT